jgi:hypothetical protein
MGARRIRSVTVAGALGIVTLGGCGDPTDVEISRLSVTLSLSADALTIGDTIQLRVVVENRTSQPDSFLVNPWCPFTVWIEDEAGERWRAAPKFCNQPGPGWHVVRPDSTYVRELRYDGTQYLTADSRAYEALPEGRYELQAEIDGPPGTTSPPLALRIGH